ncbi:alpha-amylase family protein [Flavitalea flava]
MKLCRCLLILLLLTESRTHADAGFSPAVEKPFTYTQNNFVFEWWLNADSARVIHLPNRSVIWQGSLMPSFWLQVNKQKVFVKATMNKQKGTEAAAEGGADTGTGFVNLELRIGPYGRGHLGISKETWGIRFTDLSVEWLNTPPAIIEMYFGASDEAVKRSSVWPTWDRPFLPDWQSFGFCVPGAKGGTPQSYFRMWDFGQANIALGNFGPSMGTPYGAAYPRPLLFAGMGSDEGFVAIGAGSIPDAAMSLHIQSTKGCFQYVYNEDIWGALPGKTRKWAEPLRLGMGGNAWEAFKQYYRSFPAKGPGTTAAPQSVWNSWGMWGQKKYLTRPIADFAKSVGAKVLVFDDPWEESQGAGKPNLKKFPHFFEDIAYARENGVDIGVWETVGWITDPFAYGLTKDDLILDRNGRPCKANWNFDPTEESYFCLDISSGRVREFIKNRTLGIMKTVKPAVIKLDFGYGLPSPSMGIARDPRYRGERMAHELTQLIAATAKSVNPQVTIQYYSISPLWMNNIDLVAMDDQGDLWYEIARGHQEWSLWGSLLSDKGITLGGSSGYKWELDDEVVLNTCILGPPGAVLSIYQKDELPVESKYFNHRLAIDRWFRKTIAWNPLWLDSRIGDFSAPPKMNCWGRMEKTGKDSVLTSLILRGSSAGNSLQHSTKIQSLESPGNNRRNERLASLKWEGRWGLLSQDDQDIFSTTRLAIIPFDAGTITLPYPVKPVSISQLNRAGETLFDKWEWKDGSLTIRITEEQLQETAGFLISLK